MKKLLLLELCFLFLTTTFQSDNMTGWVQQTIPRPDLVISDLQFLDSLTGFIVQSRNPDTSFISKTTDGGNSWLSTQFIHQYFTSIKFVDNNTGYCVGGENSPYAPGSVFRTTNGGSNWFLVSYVTDFIYLNDVYFPNKDTGWVCCDFVIGGGLWRTTNDGLSWQLQMNDSYNPSKIFFINSNTGWVIGNAQTKLYKTTNCGVNWFLPSNVGGTDVFFATLDTGWIIGGGGNDLNRTTNGGYNWFSVNITPPPAESRLFFIYNRR